ncbi:MAG: Hint domain-containing protein [Paracoccaceae bacterium]
MADYSIFVLGESNISLTNGTILDGVTQGDGSHLVGESLTINTTNFTEILISDSGTETNFADNDNGQSLNGAQLLDGVSYADNTGIEAEYQFVLRDDATGLEYTVLAVNITSTSPSYGTIEALAFVDVVPPSGVSLSIISAAEGPTNGGPNAIDEADIVPLCFCNGTKIQTVSGPKRVETLNAGDLIQRSNGSFARLARVFHTTLNRPALDAKPTLYPVRIIAGALGNDLPQRDLLVSRQHRMMVSSKIAERMFGQTDVLVSAIRLTALPGIFVDETQDTVSYYHLLFEAHEVILAEGAPSESLFTGPEALKTVSPKARAEIETLFPHIAQSAYTPKPACFIPPAHLQKKLVARHAKNAKPVIVQQPASGR